MSTSLVDDLRQFADDGDDLAALGDVLERLRAGAADRPDDVFDHEAIWANVDRHLGR